MAANPRKRVADDEHSYASASSRTRGTRSTNGLSSAVVAKSDRPLLPRTSSSQTCQYLSHHPRALESRFRALPNTPDPSGNAPQLPPALRRALDENLVDQGSSATSVPTVCKPAVLHRPHPDSKLCQDFHWVPYPLGLMPYDSWHKLHHRDNMQPPLPFRCPVCKKSRKATAHMRKLFLVAERLSWDDKLVSMPDKDRNEELNWTVNYELGILDPFVEDAEQIPGGKNSRLNRFHPYRNEYEMKLAFKLIFMTEDITATTWALWIGMQLDLQTMLEGGEGTETSPGATTPPPAHIKSEKQSMGTRARQRTSQPIEMIDLTGSPEPMPNPTPGRSHGLSTPPSSLSKPSHDMAATGVSKREHKTVTAPFTSSEAVGGPSKNPSPSRRIESYKTLQDFYSLLDKIERTSYVGALFLEAYAEKLRDDVCKDCWFKHNVNVDFF